MMNKRGLETQVLVTTIITIVSLVVLGIAIGKITGLFPETITKETCHSSVLARGFEIKGLSVGKALSDLKCQTSYKCLSMGGECPKGYEKIAVLNEEDIKKELANSMYDCWWMLGEGKIAFFSTAALTENNCVFCSVIHFDSEIKKKYPDVNGLVNYMAENQIPGKSQTYLNYLFGSQNQKDLKPIEVETNQDYVINFMMTEKGWLSNNWGKATTVGAIGIATIGTGAYLIGTGGLGAIPAVIAIAKVGTVAEVAAGTWLGFGIAKQSEAGDVIFTLSPFNSESIKSFGCQNIESIP